MRCELTYSPHDGGWYCTVYDERTGVDIMQTKIYATRSGALRAARNWVERNT